MSFAASQWPCLFGQILPSWSNSYKVHILQSQIQRLLLGRYPQICTVLNFGMTIFSFHYRNQQRHLYSCIQTLSIANQLRGRGGHLGEQHLKNKPLTPPVNLRLIPRSTILSHTICISFAHLTWQLLWTISHPKMRVKCPQKPPLVIEDEEQGVEEEERIASAKSC